MSIIDLFIYFYFNITFIFNLLVSSKAFIFNKTQKTVFELKNQTCSCTQMVLNIILQPRHFLNEPDHVYIKKEKKSIDSLLGAYY